MGINSSFEGLQLERLFKYFVEIYEIRMSK